MMQNSQVIQTVMGRIGVYLSHSKISNILLGLIIFFASTQFGLHFWPLSALVYGIRVDYLSPTIYFLDILIILFLAISLPKFRSSSGLQRSERQIGTSAIKIIFPILLTNLLYSHNPLATISWSLHFLLYYMFLSSVFPKFRSFSGLQHSLRQIGTSATQEFKNWRIYDLRLLLTLSLLFQTALASIQVYLGHSVGGLMYYLGERMVSVGSPGIALGTFMDHVVLRGYGTFGHPNVLAGWLVISILILLQLTRGQKQSKLLWLTTAITIFGALLTQSRAAMISLFIFIIPIYFLKTWKTKLVYFAILLSLVTCHLSLLSPPRSDLSLSQRLTLQGLSLQVIANYPIFGTGAQASISTYPSVSPNDRLLQPDHNSLTLFLSWFGIFGLLALLTAIPLPWFRSLSGLQRSKRQIRTFAISEIKVFLPILPLLLLDHYLLTSPQGMFILLALTFFLRINKPKDSIR